MKVITSSHGTTEPRAWTILVHGGAGDVPIERRALHVAGCERAAEAGRHVLAEGGRALDAVQAAVAALEDDPLFNAGTGACLNEHGAIELDASIMDGATLRAGGVCALPPFKNPILIARAVMEGSLHILLAGEGAARFAIERGFTLVDPSAMITDHARARWEAARKKPPMITAGTVGAVAKDVHGHVAAATSTGGMINKLGGRVGDSPILGAGNYADDLAAACSTTGNGEAMMRVCLAKTVVDGLSRTRSCEGAVRAALESMAARANGTGGAIVVAPDGSFGLARTTATMSWAAVTAGGATAGGARSSGS